MSTISIDGEVSNVRVFEGKKGRFWTADFASDELTCRLTGTALSGLSDVKDAIRVNAGIGGIALRQFEHRGNITVGMEAKVYDVRKL